MRRYLNELSKTNTLNKHADLTDVKYGMDALRDIEAIG